MAVLEGPGITESPLGWVEQRMYSALGFSSPADQMVSSFMLALFFYLSSVGLVVTIFLALLFTFTFFIGVARLAVQGVTG